MAMKYELTSDLMTGNSLIDAEHKQFHDGYKRQLSQTTQALIAEGPTVKALGDLNRIVGVLVSHIRIEDKKLARHVKGA